MSTFALLLIFVVLLFVFSSTQSKRRRRNAASLQQAIEPGVRVMTSSGIYGIVVETEPDTIVIEISEGVDVRFAKAAVLRVVPNLVDDHELDDASELGDADGLDFAADADGTELDDADLHAELDALGSRDADAHGSESHSSESHSSESSGSESDSADPRKAESQEPHGKKRRRGHEPGAGPVPTT